MNTQHSLLRQIASAGHLNYKVSSLDGTRSMLLALALCLLSLLLVPRALAAPGNLDPSFDPGIIDIDAGTGIAGSIASVAIQPDGKVLIGGHFGTINGVSRSGVARLNADGSLDLSFDPGSGANRPPSTYERVWKLQLLNDGKVLIGGLFTSFNGVTRPAFARLNADGSLDTSFVPAAPRFPLVYDFVVQPDGKVVVTDGTLIARLNGDGSLDSSYANASHGDGDFDAIQSLALLPDGKVLAAGYERVRRLNADGTLDPSFFVLGNSIRLVVRQPNGDILIGGEWIYVNGVETFGIARVHADGSLDATFDPVPLSGNRIVLTMALQDDGKVIIGGDFQIRPEGGGDDSIIRRGLARLNSDGSLDTSFVQTMGMDGYMGLEGPVSSIVLQADRKVLIGGGFDGIDSVNRSGIARLEGDPFPVIQNLAPDQATAGSGDIAVAVHGTGYDPAAAKVLFGNSGSQTELTPNPATSTSTRLNVVIPESLLVVAGDFAAYPITVRNPNGDISHPAGFTVLASGVAGKVDDLQTVVATSGTTATVEIPPATETDGGISATLTVSGEESASVTVATYNSDPSASGNTSFDVAGQFLDLNASGVTEADLMRVYFYFPAGTPTETLSLKFWNTRATPAAWENVTPTTIDPVLHRIEVVFDANSHPKITELDGTFFAPTVAPQIKFTGFLPPLGGADATGGSFAAPLRTFKAGSTIPVKFSATFGGAPLTTGVHFLQAIKYSDATTGGTPIDATPQEAATTGNQFRLSDQAWQFNLDTKDTGLTKGIWQLAATISDGSRHTVWIQIK